MQTTLDRVKKIVVAKLNVSEDEVNLSASFEDDLGADSLSKIELLMGLEEEFEIEIPDEDADGISTVGDVVSYIEEKTKG